ncbi:MAG: gp436 family protein [Phycisphaerae bacterium]
MAYVTNSAIEQWIGTATLVELTDDAGTGQVDTARVDEARLGAEGEADSYLATRYRVPVDVAAEDEVGAVLRTFVLDVAAYRLHSRRPPVPADIVRRHDEAVAWLSRVAAGLVQLPSAMLLPENDALGLIGDAAGPPRTMTRDSLEDV